MNQLNPDRTIKDMALFYKDFIYTPEGCDVGLEELGLTISEECILLSLDINDSDEQALSKISTTYAVDHQEICDETDDV